jgi:hypothetical protein
VLLEQHELSKCFPTIKSPEFSKLVEDIAANGLLNPIIIYDEKVLDGWHRYLACKEADADIKTIIYAGDDPTSYAWSMNGPRRHMTSSEAAKSIVDLRAWKPKGPNGPFTSAKQMAAESGTSEMQIKRAKHVTKNGSKVLNEQVKNGEISLNAAVEKIRKKKKKGPIGAAPKPPKEPKPTKSEIKALAKLQGEHESLKEIHKKLIAQFNDLTDTYESLCDEYKTYDALTGEAKKAQEEMNELRGINKLLQRRRDELMNQCAEAKRVLAHWRKRAEKCESASKPKAKK